MTTNGLESAFGFSETRYNEQGQAFSSLTRRGLTKREYFAGLALQGLMASDGKFHNWREVADSAIGAADALIAGLNQERHSNV